MGLLGTILLLFFIIHWSHFWVKSRFTGVEETFIDGKPVDDLYSLMKVTFQETWVVIVYIVACFSLCWHLIQGFQSAFRAIGVSNRRYLSMIKATGITFAIVVSVAFAMIPVGMHLGWVK